jgi:hypothetical protein
MTILIAGCGWLRERQTLKERHHVAQRPTGLQVVVGQGLPTCFLD